MTALEVIKDETMQKIEHARFINSSLDGVITDQELVYIQYVERKGELLTQVADLCKPRLQTFANPSCRPLQTQAADRVNLQQGHVVCQKGGVLKVLQAAGFPQKFKNTIP